MATTIGATVKVDGEKEFKQALADINAAMKSAASAANLATAEYDNNGKSVDALRAKYKALRDETEKQTEKIKVLEKALQASSAKYGENSRQTLAWQTKLNNAKTELVKLNAKVEENSKAIDKNGEKSNALGSIITGLGDKFGVQMPASLTKFTDGLSKTSTSGVALIGVLTGITAALAKCTVDTTKQADELLTLSSVTSISTDDLQKFEYASEFVDVSTDTLTSSLTKLVKSMNTAKDGTGEQAEAFDELGISVTDIDGDLRNSQEVFYQIIDRLGRCTNETERDALAMTLLGKSAQDLNPLIEAGSQRMKELGDEAVATGYVLSNNTLQQFGNLDDQFQKLSKTGDALKNSFAQALLPALTQLFTVISSIPTPVLQIITILVTTVATIVLAVKAIKQLTDTGKAIKGFFDATNTSSMKTTAIIMGVVIALVALAAIIAVICGKSNQLQATMDNVAQTTTQLQSNVTRTQSNVPAYARGTSYHSGGVALVGEDGPELVDLPRGSSVRTNRQTRRILGSSGAAENNTYIFKVENIETYAAIEKRLKSERQSRRMG